MVSMALKPLLQSIASTVADYRQHEIFPPTMDAAHVERWVNQFDPAVRLPLLTELDAVLRNTYITRAAVVEFLTGLCVNKKLVGSDPAKFWPTVNFIDAQQGGKSQSEMLKLFGQCLKSKLGIALKDCKSKDGPYVYLDDVLFSGNRVLNDLRAFAKVAPSSVDLHVVMIAFHSGGQWYAQTNVEKAFKEEQKKLKSDWWHIPPGFESRADRNDVDVLRPKSIPSIKAMQDYEPKMQPHGPLLRKGTYLGPRPTFATPEGRELLEQEFLIKGLDIRKMCPLLPEKHRPLGYTPLKGLGFGSTVVTFRNCPNSCPLAFWVDHPWYPLFPRKNN